MFKIGETCLYSVWILIGLPKMILGTHHKENISHKCEFFYDSLNGCQEKITLGTIYKEKVSLQQNDFKHWSQGKGFYLVWVLL